jgi:hypothetical protein
VYVALAVPVRGQHQVKRMSRRLNRDHALLLVGANTVLWACEDLSPCGRPLAGADEAAGPAGYRSLVSTLIEQPLASELACCTSG